MTNYWKFAEIPRKEELSFNKVLEKFYDYGVDGLVRENIQNSLDGRLDNSKNPVKVRIEIGIMKQDSIPGIEEIKNHIQSLKAGNSYTKETLDHMMKSTKKSKVPYILFEDMNTKGLKGASNGQNPIKGDTWSAYAYSKGVHYIDSDEKFEMSRGGSHGIGKIASNSASDIYLMYFSNCDQKNNMHIGGTIQLIDHSIESTTYRSTGYFTDEKVGEFYPYKNEFDNVFSKSTRGLKIIIPYLRTQFNNEKAIIKSVCDNFFKAIIDSKLVVKINSHIISSSTIKDYIENETYYKQDKSENKSEFTQLYFETIMKCDEEIIEIADRKKNKYKFKLYFNYNKDILRGRVGIIRTIGMKIEDKKIPGSIIKPFNAVLVPNSECEDAFLKSLENESHTELSWTHLKDMGAQKNAKFFIRNINKVISKIVEEYVRKNNPTDGVMQTQDILYEVNNKFKKSLMDKSSSLTIDSGKKNKRVLTKVATSTGKEVKSKKTKKMKKIKNEGTSSLYKVQPNMVRRAIINNQERLYIDLNKQNLVNKVNVCNIHVSLIDGMGKEYKNEVQLSESYKRIQDNNSQAIIKTDANILKEVPVINNVIHLDFEVSEKFNKTHKFAYYMEVE